MSTLEDRLRGELTRSGRATEVTAGPSVDAITETVAARRRRNRMGSMVGAGVVAIGIAAAGLFALQSDGEPSVVAAGAETSASESGAATDVGADPVQPVDGSSTQDEAVPQDDEIVEAIEQSAEADPGDQPEVSPLQADAGSPANVRVRESAVAFAGGSGVLIEFTANGQYRGLASRFGDSGATAIGISSSNGLDWEEFSISGVPSAATATHLASHNGVFVALFSQPSATGSGNEVLVGTSADLATWELSVPLSGNEVFPQHLAVGPSGVLILGDDVDRARWSGPIGGPYESGQPLTDLDMISGVSVASDGFVAVGFGRELGATVVAIGTDGEVSAAPIGLPNDVDAVAADVADGAVFVTASDASTFISGDAGLSWTRVELGSALLASAADGTTRAMLSSPFNVTVLRGDDLATTAIDTNPGDRVELLAVNGDEALLLATSEGALSWIVVEG